MIRSYQNINRRKSRAIYIGNIKIGNDAPISVQTMTNTLTTDIKSTLSQIKRIENTVLIENQRNISKRTQKFKYKENDFNWISDTSNLTSSFIGYKKSFGEKF